MNILTISTTIITILASFAIAAPFKDRPVESNCGMNFVTACSWKKSVGGEEQKAV